MNDATVTAVGNLIKEPTHTTSKSGSTIVNFTIGVNTTMKDEKGEFESNFYNVSVFGKSAEFLLERIQKGTQVEVTGDLILQRYTDKQTNEARTSLNIQAYKVRPLQRMKPAPQRSMDPEVTGERPF